MHAVLHPATRQPSSQGSLRRPGNSLENRRKGRNRRGYPVSVVDDGGETWVWLTANETALFALLTSENRPFSHEEVKQAVWGGNVKNYEESVQVLAYELRKKLRRVGLTAVRARNSLGYTFR